MTSTTDARLVDALALAAQAVDELVIDTVRDTQRAFTDRVYGALRLPTNNLLRVPEQLHRMVASSVYGGIGLGLRTAARGLGAVGDAGLGPALDSGTRSRAVRAAVNGLIGDKLREERPRLAIELAVRVGDADVELTHRSLTSAFPMATGSVAVFVHGLTGSESQWRRDAEQQGRTYADTVAEVGWTPIMVRANTGLSLRENGVALSSLLDRLMEEWPTQIDRIALVGHSMGGLVIRAASAVVSAEPAAPSGWVDRVTDVVTLGTPHLGAPLARGVEDGSRLLARLPETAAFGRILDWRSVGVDGLVAGLDEEVPALPHARYRLVSATLTRDPRHPLGRLVGDLLVRTSSAYGTGRSGRRLFPDAETLHVPATSHAALLNHPDLHAALRRWLG